VAEPTDLAQDQQPPTDDARSAGVAVDTLSAAREEDIAAVVTICSAVVVHAVLEALAHLVTRRAATT
jgi:hypothetical protein